MSVYDRMSDTRVIEELKELDNEADIEVSSWEADFIENVVYKHPERGLTARQREVAIAILDRYYS